jgi:hypothetical protein
MQKAVFVFDAEDERKHAEFTRPSAPQKEARVERRF